MYKMYIVDKYECDKEVMVYKVYNYPSKKWNAPVHFHLHAVGCVHSISSKYEFNHAAGISLQ